MSDNLVGTEDRDIEKDLENENINEIYILNGWIWKRRLLVGDQEDLITEE